MRHDEQGTYIAVHNLRDEEKAALLDLRQFAGHPVRDLLNPGVPQPAIGGEVYRIEMAGYQSVWLEVQETP